MKKIGYLLTFILSFSFTPVFAADADWLANEILTQLSDLRRDMKRLKDQVNDLQDEIKTLKTSNKGSVKKKPLLTSFELGTGNFMGDKDAKLAVVEFTDYQCPFCGRHAKGTLEQIKEKYINQGKLQYVIRDFPLNFHKQGKSAAVAAACSGDQGKYWEMHEKLFQNPKKINQKGYQLLASELELNADNFSQCLEDPAQMRRVESDIALGNSLGITGTPAFIIGRIEDGKLTDLKALTGALPFSSFTRVIDKMIN